MHDTVEVAFESGLDHLRIGDVATDDLDVRIGMRLKINDANVRARRRQRGYGVTADEARSAGHQYSLAGQGARCGGHAPASVAVFGTSIRIRVLLIPWSRFGPRR